MIWALIDTGSACPSSAALFGILIWRPLRSAVTPAFCSVKSQSETRLCRLTGRHMMLPRPWSRLQSMFLQMDGRRSSIAQTTKYGGRVSVSFSSFRYNVCLYPLHDPQVAVTSGCLSPLTSHQRLMPHPTTAGI
ncbi:hypothetical protein BO94DRAFT_6451 [Aspergillus sclerotioniger CBS 115572]|uniref:Uncharacterized protein n=1 Tax=Aspergillus sclerotioniger CBS 115572 TaxID=1450535 RepID=A0A317XF19_9EURO|nr:hypothetical protein BO94DRAFT_6451 [Aspergillus sclerotioniger CBS 115572]PWY96327.1 hypothetical protein BO94DRAFT_6451 [Aspergillus sclerotioniger CBS 115572]